MKTALLLAVCLLGGCLPQSEPLPASAEMIVREASAVTVYRMGPENYGSDGQPLKIRGPEIDGYPILERREVSDATRAELSNVLSSPGFYKVDSSMCVLEPGWAVEFARGAESVTILVCFKCGDVEFVGTPGSGAEDVSRRGMRSKDLSGRLHRALSTVLPQQPPA
jgi:hypothetical protein